MWTYGDKEELKQQIDYLEKIKDFDGLTPGDERWLKELKESKTYLIRRENETKRTQG